MKASLTPYKPSLLFRNPHLNTMYPVFMRKLPTVPYQRQRIDTLDEDFLDVDLLRANNSKVAFLFHGLEGSSDSQYIKATALRLHAFGWDIVAMNYRSCSGEVNKQLRVYHAGCSDDVETVVNTYLPAYDSAALVGFSLGGNISFNYVGERASNLDTRIKALVGVSMPFDLNAGIVQLARPSNYLYEKNFILTLTQKTKQKIVQYPDFYTEAKLKQVRSLYDFDNLFTGPANGYSGADAYYTACSCLKHVAHLPIPTTIINAMDDPFLPEESYPHVAVAKNPKVSLHTPKYGGHVGFANFSSSDYWLEQTIQEILSDVHK